MARHDQDLKLIGSSPAFLAAIEQVSRLAALDKPVLVVGERGTGKELIAERLHYLSPRWQRSLVKVNCAAITESLLESELFGHEAGAFTGANRRHQGRFELAHGGTLFLDELASTSMRVQEKVLRVIEYGEFERVGGQQTLKVDVRLVGAANVDLPALAAEGRFREDLLDRLAFDVVTLPPLRERREDIIPLAEHYATKMARELARDYFAGFSKPALKALLGYPWPGNVRELKNVVERAVYRSEDPEAPIDEVIFDPFASPWRPRRRNAAQPDPAKAETGPADPPPTALPDARTGPVDFVAAVRSFELRLIEQALAACRYNQRRAAAHLGLSYHQLRGHLRKYGLTESGK